VDAFDLLEDLLSRLGFFEFVSGRADETGEYLKIHPASL